MRRSRCEVELAPWRFAAALLLMLMLAVAASGCATSTAEQTAVSLARVEIEEDGLPPQVAPPAIVRQQVNDPSEPFSRDYGSRIFMRLLPASARMTDAEAEALIARAIAEHEMRRP